VKCVRTDSDVITQHSRCTTVRNTGTEIKLSFDVPGT